VAGNLREAFEIFSIVLLLFGGLAFWPLVRYGAGQAGGVADWLKWQFYGHIALLAVAFVPVLYYFAIEHPDRLHVLILPYATGAVSWVCALIILVGGGLWRRIGKDSSVPD
jgi:hypothetical protein